MCVYLSESMCFLSFNNKLLVIVIALSVLVLYVCLNGEDSVILRTKHINQN